MGTRRWVPAVGSVLAATVIVALAAGCGGDDAEGSSGGPGTTNDAEASIDGAYVATEVVEDGRPRELVEGTDIRLQLEAGHLTAHAGCNTIGGPYVLDDDVLQVGAMSTTDMGCDPRRHAQDEWFAGVLAAGPALERVEDGFVLRTGTSVVTFVERAIVEPDLELTATPWVVESYRSGSGPDGAVSSAPDHGARVTFEPNGFVSGHDGCNGFGYAGEAGVPPTDGLRYDVDGDAITFTGSPVSTQIACPERDTGPFWAALAGTVAWGIEGTRLTLIGADGAGMVLRADA